MFIAEVLTDIDTCSRKNIHMRTKEEITQVLNISIEINKWEPKITPLYFNMRMYVDWSLVRHLIIVK